MAPVWHFVRRVGPFLVGAAAVVFILNAVVAAQHLPEYASWTGIRPLEEKLQKLDRFSSQGPVDALVLGSSISDFGINAKLLSERVTAATGEPYRVFNFSTGATELVTTPTLYRMARTVSKPRTLLLTLPEEGRGPDAIPPRSPDYIMRRAPIRTAIAHPWLFPLEKRFWDIPMVRYAAPLRDRLVYGRFANLVGQGADLYWIDDFGDTVNYAYQTNKADLKFLRTAHETMLVPLTEKQMSAWSQPAKLEHYYSKLDISAMTELRKLTAADGCQIVIVATDVASIYYPVPPTDPTFVRARRQFFGILAHELHAKLVYDVEKFKAQQYMLTDTVHLNHYGANAFTSLVAASLTHSADPRVSPRVEHPTLPDMPSSDPTISGFSALIEAPKHKRALTLRLTILRNEAIPPLPNIPLQVMLRLPDNTDVTAQARLTSDTSVEATFANLPTGPDKLFLARIVYEAGGRLAAHNQPISADSWSR